MCQGKNENILIQKKFRVITAKVLKMKHLKIYIKNFLTVILQLWKFFICQARVSRQLFYLQNWKAIRSNNGLFSK